MKERCLKLADLMGLWRRSLIAWPDGRRDTTTRVLWLQGLSAFGDLRRPLAARFPRARSLRGYSRQDCALLAQQQAFAGHLTVAGKYFEWERRIDFQPKSLRADAGSLRFENAVLIEEGRDVDYIEHWHRDPDVAREPAAAVSLLDGVRGTKASLVRVGEHYIFARARDIELPPGTSLSECVAAAATVVEARAVVDCEISFGVAAPQAVRITASTLPFRVGESLSTGLGRHWEIQGSEGDPIALAEIKKLAL